MQELFDRFRHLKDEYSFLKKKCERNVRVWRWAKNPRHDPRPFWYERNRWKAGRLLPNPPQRPNGYYEYGYDASGNLLVVRQLVFSEPRRHWFHETFFTREGNIVESAHFDYAPDKKPVNLIRSTYRNNQIILWESCAQRGNTRERYLWDEQHIILIEIDHISLRDERQFIEPLPWQRVEIRYNEQNLVEEIVEHYIKHPEQPEEVSQVVYRRIAEMMGLDVILERTKMRLFETIKNKVISLGLDELAYCLTIAWSPGQFSSLPPHIAIGFERDRERWIEQYGKEAKWYLWNQAEFSFCILYNPTLADSELVELCDLVNQECGRRHHWGDGAKMLNDVAKMLNQVNWSGILKTTPDFVVYATDLELGDLRKNLRYSIPRDLYNHFNKQGWIP